MYTAWKLRIHCQKNIAKAALHKLMSIIVKNVHFKVSSTTSSTSKMVWAKAKAQIFSKEGT